MAESTRLYAGTQEGMVVVKANGNSWEVVNHVFKDKVLESVSGCRRDPKRVYAGVAYDGLYRTDDGGLNWTKVFDGDVRSTSVDPTNEDVVYTGTEGVYLYCSEDRGNTWTENTALRALPNEVRSKWWTPYPPALGHVITIYIHPDDGNMIHLCIEHGGILRSFDQGETWEEVDEGIDYLDIHVISPLPHRFDKWFVSSARGFFTTDDPGKGWVRAENGFTRDYFHDFIFLPPEREGANPTMLMATADHSPGSWHRPEYARAALFRSDDVAKSWHRVIEGLAEEMEPMVWALTNHPTDPNAAFAGIGRVSRGPAQGPTGPGCIMVTRDRGDSWQKVIDVPGDRVLWAATE
jgi:photosystem II stability/assembly factor-like uncharacterized protein